MKLIEDLLFLEFADLVSCGVSENYLSKARSTGVKCISFMDDPGDRRKVLIKYEPLSDRYKQMVLARFGNPYDYVSRDPIRRMVTKDLKAEEFYLSYKLDNGEALPIEYVKKYSKSCDWLNMLNMIENDKAIVKKQLKLPLASFYNHVIGIIKSDEIDLPTTYKYLRKKMVEYSESGYNSLIEKWRFNNSFAAKVKDELSQSTLLELISDDSKHDDVIISRIYNKWAKEHGYKTITDATVGNWRREHEVEILMSRNGTKDFYNKYGKHILRKRPSSPLLLVGGDGNDWDMYFQGEKASTQTYYFNLFTLVVVIDAYNNYPLGWSISEPNGNENAALIKAAYVDALVHIKDLTGGYYLPHQLQNDRFAQKELKPFFEKIDPVFFFAAARAPRGKYIESSFGTTWHQVLRTYKNYSGHNVGASTKINPERIEREKRTFPHVSEAFDYANHFITQLRNIIDDEATGKTRQEQWIDAFASSEKSQQRLISDDQFLYNFGLPNGNMQTISNRGLVMQLNNVEYIYEIPDEFYLQTVGKKVQVIYDGYDFSRVMVTDNDKLRFIAKSVKYVPAAKADYNDGDEQRLWKRLHQKKQHMLTIAALKNNRQKVLVENGINPAALLQAGILDKGIKRTAEIGYHQQQFSKPNSQQEIDPLDQM